jgi:hypothetical protein
MRTIATPHGGDSRLAREGRLCLGEGGAPSLLVSARGRGLAIANRAPSREFRGRCSNGRVIRVRHNPVSSDYARRFPAIPASAKVLRAPAQARRAPRPGGPQNVVTLADIDGAKQHDVRFSNGFQGHAFHAFTEIGALIEAGRFWLPVERTYALDEISEARRVSEYGHVRGRLVLVID